MLRPVPNCFRFDWQLALRAFPLARAKTGKRIAARIAMMAITTSNAIRVKPDVLFGTRLPFQACGLLALKNTLRPSSARVPQ
jgi:hypothetical protein